MWPTLREQTHLKWNLHSLTFKISSFNLSFFLLGCVKARSHDSQVQPFSFFLFFREALWSKKYLGPIFVNSINGGILALTSSYTAYKWRIKGLPDYKSNESFWQYKSQLCQALVLMELQNSIGQEKFKLCVRYFANFFTGLLLVNAKK